MTTFHNTLKLIWSNLSTIVTTIWTCSVSHRIACSINGRGVMQTAHFPRLTGPAGSRRPPGGAGVRQPVCTGGAPGERADAGQQHRHPPPAGPHAVPVRQAAGPQGTCHSLKPCFSLTLCPVFASRMLTFSATHQVHILLNISIFLRWPSLAHTDRTTFESLKGSERSHHEV